VTRAAELAAITGWQLGLPPPLLLALVLVLLLLPSMLPEFNLPLLVLPLLLALPAASLKLAGSSASGCQLPSASCPV
jgi:hypothetical protein